MLEGIAFIRFFFVHKITTEVDVHIEHKDGLQNI